MQLMTTTTTTTSHNSMRGASFTCVSSLCLHVSGSGRTGAPSRKTSAARRSTSFGNTVAIMSAVIFARTIVEYVIFSGTFTPSA
eukprot:CAMPEP_0179720862 /NCGR_PEP_ID=MMETSP0938-20121108/4178_1 /TAXON_ID=548131 ORGANISM="Ostreococcus mediterraneus, Strain clade-D-RCC1107" /NCGR_SAMPLE_ID=MMETSP0938 /ASSEMBLY_ACC=CAM_ASM_000576 /LENGTH=83 /DNA_ID=CAMNT_0021594779 /DNA_START=169 /DNA_END=420 /DNA_ORIENTATION=-